MCEMLAISSSGYDRWRKHEPSHRVRDDATLDQIWGRMRPIYRQATGVLYLAVVMDLDLRRILGWAMSIQQTTDLTCDALREALRQRSGRSIPVILHSDRGSQYTSTEFRALGETEGVIQSMGRTGNCYDNSQIESFFRVTEKACVSNLSQPNRVTISREVICWMEAWYSSHRLHSQLDCLSPVAFERRAASTTLERAGNVT